MSWYQVGRKVKEGSSLPFAVAGILLGLVLMVVAYQVFLTVPVRLDGNDIRVNAGMRVGELVRTRGVKARQGDLVSASQRKVLKRGGGGAPWISVNGKAAEVTDPLYAADVVASMNGSDVVEPVQTRREDIPAPVRYQGDGPMQTVLDPGSPGVREVRFGTISKEVVSERVVQEPRVRVVKRVAPPKGAKLVALTFDDGPWPETTLKIVDILKKNDVPASFFMIGGQARRRPAIARAVADAGMLVCNHSESHPMMQRMSFGSVSKQILNANADIEKATGQRPKYFRPPGGNVNPAMKEILDKQGMKMVLWDVDTLDWRKPPVTAILDRVGRARSGSVILMHDGGGDRTKTVEALPYVIQLLRKQGYVFVTLDAIGTGRNTIR